MAKKNKKTFPSNLKPFETLGLPDNFKIEDFKIKESPVRKLGYFTLNKQKK